MTADGLSRRLARHAAIAQLSAIPDEALAATKASVLDQLGVILAASGLGEACAPFIAQARDEGTGRATVLGCGFRSSASQAAFANGSMAHALDFEDTHDATLVHPMASVLPAALAVAESTGASGADLLAAIAVGADVSCRLALAFEGNPERADGFLLLPFLGVYGATAAAGRLLCCSPEQMEQAFSLAFFQVSGSAAVQRYEKSDVRGVRDAFNARAGVTAARLARDGVHGFDQPFEGPAGYFALYAAGRCNAVRALERLGDRYEGAAVSFKPWPSCRGSHAFVQAALSLASRHAVEPRQVTGIRATVSPFFRVLCEPSELRARPSNAVGAKFSIPFTVGVALAKGRVAFEHFDAQGLQDPDVLRLAALMRHDVQPDWEQAQSTRGALEIRLSDGRCLREEVRYPRGHPLNPMSTDELRSKFLDCAALARQPMTMAQAEAVVDRVRLLENLQRAADLLG